MNPYRCRIALLVLAVFFVCFTQPATADYLYTVSYDSLTIDWGWYGGVGVQTIAADSFSFTVESLILPSLSQTVMTPGGELNGNTFESLDAWRYAPSLALMQQAPAWNTHPIGSVAGLLFFTDTWPDAVGIYSSTGRAGRLVVLDTEGSGWGQYFYSNGSLTITEMAASVPEPAAMLLLGSGLIGLWGFRRKFNK